MRPVTADQLVEFQSIVSKMPLEVCVAYLPLMGLKWHDLSHFIKNYKLPMTSASASKILKRHLAKTSHYKQMNFIIAKLKLSFVATSGSKVWHAVKMSESLFEDQPIATLVTVIPERIKEAAVKYAAKFGSNIEVHSLKLGDFLYLSVRVSSASKLRRPAELYVAAPPGESVAFFTTMAHKRIIKAVVLGLGYKAFEDAQLHGQDIVSLLRIIDRTWNTDVNNLADMPEYNPLPVVTREGIDYTSQTYNEMYVDNVMGPNPPSLTEMEIKSAKSFFDPAILNEDMPINLSVHSENIAETLKALVKNRSMAPTSVLFHIFNQTKSNKVVYWPEE